MAKIKTTTLYTLIVPLIVIGLAAGFSGCKETPGKEIRYRTKTRSIQKGTQTIIYSAE